MNSPRSEPGAGMHAGKTGAEMQRCIDACLACHATCVSMLARHCVEHGGAHVEAGHVRTMLACAEVCRAAAAVMMIGEPHHRALCQVCADICTACAESCAAVGDMDACVAACRACADACRAMAGTHRH